MIGKIVKKISTIKNQKLYSPKDIMELGVILNAASKPSREVVYRLIRSGHLKAIRAGAGEDQPNYLIEGKELKRFLKRRYNLE